MSHVNEVGLVAVMGMIIVGAMVHAQTNSTPIPPHELDIYPPEYPEGTEVSTNDTDGITLSIPEKDHMWELTFVWYPDTGFTNGTTYPIVMHVPFKHDQGFIRVVAKQVDM